MFERNIKIFFALFLLFVIIMMTLSVLNFKKIALVYKGPGVCPEDCGEAAAYMAKLAGFDVKYIGPDLKDNAVFEKASVWIQPGGSSSEAAQAMVPELKENIRKFVQSGGGYVGYCAGGFLSNEFIDVRGPGLGIMPGKNALYEKVRGEVEMITVNWLGKDRNIYWEGGPYFMITPETPDLEILARYPDGSIATAQSRFGKGKVVVTGLHPEAPTWWAPDEKVQDTDGEDWDLAIDMIKRATTP